ncbi:hypothetical protein EDD18DRAFT_1465075 [Armillaria luteobubalina]|uniref:Uncharacterized protein n=1 Tax=Armillaria luteobubalina TaxID=153913 RepID=A0AA39PZ30_9AGAR|nr:hypothetical protein EDD18DRAFT_1465075 [Armillaria luteobubalina]
MLSEFVAQCSAALNTPLPLQTPPATTSALVLSSASTHNLPLAATTAIPSTAAATIRRSPNKNFPYYCRLHLFCLTEELSGHTTRISTFRLDVLGALPLKMPDKISAVNDSPPYLPQELIDYTLDFLHDDVPVLRMCSLASNCLLPRSRRNYMSGNCTDADFDALLKHSPHIAPLVRTLGIHAMGVQTISEIMVELCGDPSLHSIFASLHNLSRIQLVDRRGLTDWDCFPSVFQEIFLRTLRSVRLTTVHLKGISYNTNADLEDVSTAVANPALKHLSIDSESAEITSSNLSLPLAIRAPANGRPELESLSMSGDAVFLQIEFLFFTRSLYNISHVRQLSLQLGTDTKEWVMQVFLHEMRDTLESLTLDVTPNLPGTQVYVLISIIYTYIFRLKCWPRLQTIKKLKSFFVVLHIEMNTWLFKTYFGAALQKFTVELLTTIGPQLILH